MSHNPGAGGAQGNFSTMTQNVLNNLHHLQNTPAQKKNVSSKNQQRRKISATTQSAQFQANGSQLLQSTINYPHTIKKKSSKAKMLVGGEAATINGQPMISAFPGGPAASNVRAGEHPGGGADRDVSLQFETVFQNTLDLETLNL